MKTLILNSKKNYKKSFLSNTYFNRNYKTKLSQRDFLNFS